jgi:hypothetical protein
MGGQSFIEFEPVPDVNPPIAELITSNKNKAVIVTDDGRDDLGIRAISFEKQSNINVKIPKFFEGAPSVILDAHPINHSAPGSIVLRLTDVAGNES